MPQIKVIIMIKAVRFLFDRAGEEFASNHKAPARAMKYNAVIAAVSAGAAVMSEREIDRGKGSSRKPTMRYIEMASIAVISRMKLMTGVRMPQRSFRR